MKAHAFFLKKSAFIATTKIGGNAEFKHKIKQTNKIKRKKEN